jgi:hypothetical protein
MAFLAGLTDTLIALRDQPGAGIAIARHLAEHLSPQQARAFGRALADVSVELTIVYADALKGPRGRPHCSQCAGHTVQSRTVDIATEIIDGSALA